MGFELCDDVDDEKQQQQPSGGSAENRIPLTVAQKLLQEHNGKVDSVVQALLARAQTAENT